jgi:Uma2 family endonuclease
MTTAIAQRDLARTDWTKEEAAEYMERCHPDVRYELIQGEIVPIMPSQRHIYAVDDVCHWLREVFGWRRVRQEADITLQLPDDKTNILLPDGAVTREEKDAYLTRHPAPEDILLLVEVSESSVRDDTNKKRRLYAASLIREYWVLAIKARKLYVYREPSGGDYPKPRVYGEEELVATLAAPEAVVRVGDLLPPVEEPEP